jgi:ubiquinone/menaquinone biosynthesis C-methylase UbiE
MSWDDYAPFYDWENARTMGRRDLLFWKGFAAGRGRTLELGCGTGRLLIPLSRIGARMTGVDLSAAMLDRARERARRLPRTRRPHLIRGDITQLPFADGSYSRVFAPYGVLQSLLSDGAFDAALLEAARVLSDGGRFGLELIPELTSWRPYQRELRFRGRLAGAQITLVESVRQDRKRRLTTFYEEFTVRRGSKVVRKRFPLTFRSLPMEDVLLRLQSAGFEVEAVQGGYRGGVWTPDSDVWLVTARCVRAPAPSDS